MNNRSITGFRKISLFEREGQVVSLEQECTCFIYKLALTLFIIQYVKESYEKTNFYLFFNNCIIMYNLCCSRSEIAKKFKIGQATVSRFRREQQAENDTGKDKIKPNKNSQLRDYNFHDSSFEIKRKKLAYRAYRYRKKRRIEQ